ncbi:G2/M phase-specific E3 ubiquitin-protein ligase-like [Astyanax mexicanus]|uniref:G2/M phase-specific E3 ubiquitin-protein ligase-like n=1 Tax=Astyanax mexicanus TaxID=7994 RepID=UPI0020CAD1FF|nr:G2/M phase-specific E3 ubiquitin-protein ligase-like [Astyanax mexicanus]
MLIALYAKKNTARAQAMATSVLNTPHSFYKEYTSVYAPIVIDSSSESEENVEPQEEDSTGLAASDVVSNLSLKIDPTSFNRFNINRANVWDGAIRGFKRSAYNPSYDMLVKFSDDVGQTEDSIDTGGPKREFLTLLLDAIRTRRVFEGRSSAKYLAFNSQAADEDEYFHVGRMIAVSIVHGGPGPRCLSPNLFEYLIGKVKSIEAPIEDIPDEEVKNSLFEV